MKAKRTSLAALADAAGSVRTARVEPVRQEQPSPQMALGNPKPVPPSRRGNKPITAFFPEDVRIQLKMFAAEQGRSMESVIGEALNDLFAKYGKPEIVPVASSRR